MLTKLYRRVTHPTRPSFLLQATFIALFSLLASAPNAFSQTLKMPNRGVNPPCLAGRTVGLTDIEIRWNAPGVKGREGKVWGTDIAWYGFTVLGFGSDGKSPWRAGADESTVISFSTDVDIEGKRLPAGKYGFFIALGPDSSTLIFSKNTSGWGSYFYRPEWDVLRVTVKQQKDRPQSVETLAYTFSEQTDHSVVAALEWERWRIPFLISVDVKATALASIQSQMSGAIGFDPPSLQAAAQWCLNNDVNLDGALAWINTATNPQLGGLKNFGVLSVKSEILRKKGQTKEAEQTMNDALSQATVLELHGYGRRLLTEKKPKEALAVFERNYKQNGDAWPTHVGLMRGYSANGDAKKALEHAKIALTQAPDDLNKRNLENMVKTLSEGKLLTQ